MLQQSLDTLIKTKQQVLTDLGKQVDNHFLTLTNLRREIEDLKKELGVLEWAYNTREQSPEEQSPALITTDIKREAVYTSEYDSECSLPTTVLFEDYVLKQSHGHRYLLRSSSIKSNFFNKKHCTLKCCS